MYLLGLDIGTSSIKAAIIDADSGLCVSSCLSPETEMEIIALKSGWAEQDPDAWWNHTQLAIKAAIQKAGIKEDDIKAIGISYQKIGRAHV